jgi:hypothetical protein
MLPISKTTFLQFQICPKDTWLRLHKPVLVESFRLTEFEKHLLEQGNEVEEQARRLFPDAVLITANGEEACEETRRLMAGSTNAISGSIRPDLGNGAATAAFGESCRHSGHVFCLHGGIDCVDLIEMKAQQEAMVARIIAQAFEAAKQTEATNE